MDAAMNPEKDERIMARLAGLHDLALQAKRMIV
jgi:hypothetical protein